MKTCARANLYKRYARASGHGFDQPLQLLLQHDGLQTDECGDPARHCGAYRRAAVVLVVDVVHVVHVYKQCNQILQVCLFVYVVTKFSTCSKMKFECRHLYLNIFLHEGHVSVVVVSLHSRFLIVVRQLIFVFVYVVRLGGLRICDVQTSFSCVSMKKPFEVNCTVEVFILSSEKN